MIYNVLEVTGDIIISAINITGNVLVGSGSVHPVYTGESTVTPTSYTQVLYTDGYLLESNITVNPIPSNYGLITWNGSYLTVS